MRIVILRLSRVTSLDVTGAQVLGDAINRLERRGITVLPSGIRPGHDQILATLGVAETLRESGRVFLDTPAAISYARNLVHAEPLVAHPDLDASLHDEAAEKIRRELSPSASDLL